MKKTFIIFRHELIITFKRMAFIILTLAIPVVMFLGWSVYQGVQRWYHVGPVEIHKIGFVDNARIVTGFTEQKDYTFIRYENQDSAKSALISDEIGEYLIILPDYINSGRVVIFTLEKGAEISSGTEKRLQLIGKFLSSNLIGDNVNAEIRERALSSPSVMRIKLDKTGEIAEEKNPFIEYILPYIFGLLFIFSIFFTSGYLLQGISEEKENRVIEILLSSVSARQLLMGKMLGLGAAGLCQMIIWLMSMRIFTEILSVNIPSLSVLHIPASMMAFGLIYFVLGYFLFAALSTMIGAIGNTARESQQLSTIFTLPAVLPYMIQMVIIGNPESVVSKVFTLFPLTAPITIMMRLPLEAIASWEIILSIMILIFSIIFLLWFGSKIFRTTILIYGKRPGLKEIIRLLKSA